MNATLTSSFRAAHPVKHADLGGVSWDYVVAGEGKSGLLLLGSELACGDHHHRLVSLFQRDFRVIAPMWPERASVEEVLDGLVALMEFEGLAHAAVFGNGFGAGVAHALARRSPGRVDTLVLTGFGLCSSIHALELRAHAAAFRVLPPASLRQHYLKSFERLATDAGARGDELRAAADRMISRHTHASALHRFELMVELFAHPETFHLHQQLERPEKVLLLLASDDHSFTREEQNALVKTYAAPTVTRYLNGGHWIGLLPAQEFERKLTLHLQRFSLPTSRRTLLAPRSHAEPALDADTLEWRQDRRLG